MIRLSIYKTLSLFAILLVLASCSTKKNKWINRAYHNTTSKFNVYFNGNESFKQGVKKTKDAHTDNYTLILPVFEFSDENASKASLSSMEKTLKKTSKVIKKHSITVKPERKEGKMTKKEKAFYNQKEFCKWIDDSYLLLGKANFYERKFFDADQAFKYIVKEYSDDYVKFEAQIWLARSLNEQKKYGKAIELLERINGEREFPKKLRDELATTFADSYMKQQRYNEAVPWLRKAIEAKGKKRVKARYKFILAQIYQEFGKNSNASNLYKEVIKMNPPYEMAFRAKINRATSFDVEAGGAKDIIRQLEKMLKDDKNIEYQDQIYYALANIYYVQKDVPNAIENYKLSVRTSVSNTDQQALSYLAIADIYFARPDYQNAQAYYDSCISYLDVNYPKYKEIKSKVNNLTSLVTNLNIVQNEDSLQMVAGLTERQRDKLINKIIQKVIDKEQAEKEREQQLAQNAMLFDQNQRTQNQQNTGGKWYFYNQTAMGFGMSEFKKKWGARKLEDNWRRKNKSVMMVMNEDEFAEEGDTGKKAIDNKSIEYYLRGLPLTDSLIAVSEGRIEEAMFKIGVDYKEKLENFEKSIEAFELLVKRFPKTEYLLHTYYYLYQLNTVITNTTRANYYKDLIIGKYPESNYAKVLSDPNYLKLLEAENNKNKIVYEGAYEQFENRMFNASLTKLNDIDTTMLAAELAPKVSLLRALSYGGIKDVIKYKSELKRVIKAFPKTEEGKVATIILGHLNSPDYSVNDSSLTVQTEDVIPSENTNVEVVVEEIYNYVEETQHFYMMIIEDSEINYNRLKFNIVNYNIDKFPMFDFDVKVKKLNKTTHLITIQSLDNAKQASKYFKAINRKKDLFKDISEGKLKQFTISSNNYKNLVKDLDVSKYEKFYLENYNK